MIIHFNLPDMSFRQYFGNKDIRSVFLDTFYEQLIVLRNFKLSVTFGFCIQ